MVVGTKYTTCFPSWIALNAARRAISVFPYPTSPQTKRSIILRLSISFFVASIASSWSSVSSCGNSSSNSRCQTVSSLYWNPFAPCLAAYSSTSSLAIAFTSPLTLAFVFFHCSPPSRFSFGALESAPAYFWTPSRRVAGTYRFPPSAYSIFK